MKLDRIYSLIGSLLATASLTGGCAHTRPEAARHPANDGSCASLFALEAWSESVKDSGIPWTQSLNDEFRDPYQLPFRSNSESLRALIEEQGANHFSIAVPARYRAGKSSLLTNIENWWSSSGGIVISLDAATITDAALALRGLQRIASRGKGIPPAVIEAMEAKTDFFDALETLANHAREAKRPLLLQFDEATVFFTNRKEVLGDFYEKLRFVQGANLILYYPDSPAQLAATRRKLAEDKNPGGFHVFDMKPESPETVRAFLDRVFRASNARISNDAIQAIYEASGGWPYEIMQILRVIPATTTQVDRAAIVQAIEDLQINVAQMNIELHPLTSPSTP